MTFETGSMTMPSVDCPPAYAPNQRTFVLERIKQRVGNYERHGQRCADRHALAQRTIRNTEKLETARLWQRAQDNLKNKKGAKCRMDSTRQKVPSVDPLDNDSNYQGLSLARVGPSLKRKMPMPVDPLEAPGYGDSQQQKQQQEAKKMKNDQPNLNNNQGRQEYPLPSVSVQIVQNFNGEPTNQIETTVNVQHSNRNMPDTQSVRVNVDSKNIKQEMDGRRGQQQQQQQQQMNQQNMNQCPSTNTDATDLDGLLGDNFIPGTEDIDFNMLHDIIEQMPEMMDSFDRDLMTPDGQRQNMTSQSQPMTSQSPQMTSQSPQMTSHSHQTHHHMMSQSHHPMTSQSPQMTSPPHQHVMSQSPHMTSQSHHSMASQSPRMAPQTHQHMPSQSPRMAPQQPHQPHHHNMTSQSPQMTSQYPPHHNMTSHPHNMTSPLRHMSSPPIQHMSSPPMMPQNARMVCKREKVDMYHGFHGNTPLPENKREQHGLPRQNSHGMTQQNISANIVTRQSVQMTGAGNFSANLSAQQNISVNMMQQNNFTTNPRVVQTNNNNMTSQHIHRLNQVAQFGAHEPTQHEASRMFHTSANPHAQTQPSYYESHSQQLKQLAEKQGYGMNRGSGPMNMNPDPRSAQHFPPHYRGDGPPAMSQPINMPNHHHHHPNMPPSSAQRVPHMDASVYSRSSQYVQSQRPGVNVMMQQSEAMMMKQYQMQPNQHPGYYNRVPEPHPQQIMPSNPNPGYPPGTGPHPSWNTAPRAGAWAPPNSHNPMHRPHVTPDHRSQMNLDHMRAQMNPDLTPQNYLPELVDSDLNIIDEILSKTNA